jgi:hypothetical protein
MVLGQVRLDELGEREHPAIRRSRRSCSSSRSSASRASCSDANPPRCTRFELRAPVRFVRGRDRVAAGGMDRAREARRRSEGACRLRAPLVHPRRAEFPKTEASIRAVPLRALDALDRIGNGNGSPLVFPGSGAATSGAPPRRPPASIRSDGSTIFGTPLRPSRSAPASQPSTSPATWAPA